MRGLGGAYLLWLGITLLRARSSPRSDARPEPAGLASSFLVGLLITLADQKAILFYLGFFPAFVDLQVIAPIDVVAIIAVTIVAVGGVKLGYAYAAERAVSVAGGRAGVVLCRAAGVALVAAGSWLVVGALTGRA